MERNFYNVLVKEYYKQEAYHDISGYELELVRTDKEFQSWQEPEFELESARRKMLYIAEALRESESYKKIERVSDDCIRVIKWYSIGD